MTPYQQAKQLLNSFGDNTEHALKCVDEIVAAMVDYGQDTFELQNMDRFLVYWENVKRAIKHK